VIGPLSDKLGRRRLLFIASIIFTVGALLSGLSPSFIFLVLSRIILGVAVGIASALIPTYLAELAPPEKRGGISSLFQLMIMSGILLAYISNYLLSNLFYGWRWMVALAAVPSLVLMIGSFVLPESPRFLVKQGRNQEALAVLERFASNKEFAVSELRDIQEKAKIQEVRFRALFGKTVRPVLIMAAGLAIFQQVMGCNTVLYYAPTIFTEVGFGVHAALIAHIGMGIFNVIITWVAVMVMDKIDRKKMLVYGALGMGVSLFVMSISMKLSSEDSKVASYVCAVALTVYIIFFCGTWGPVRWVMIGESFPLSIRGLGNSWGAMVNWIANTIVSLTFPPLLNFFGTGSLFIGYGVLCFLSIIFVRYRTFETRGRTLEEIEGRLRSGTIFGS
jgi:sugar porter (SP) family MFS transporter